MTVLEATNFIRSAVGYAEGQTWADLGAGEGTFTRALAELVGARGRIIALDHDDVAIGELRRIGHDNPARIDVIIGDVTHLANVAELHDIPLDGAILANVLHFVRDPAQVLAEVRNRVRSDGRIIVVEYDRRAASGWVPFPLPFGRLVEIATSIGFASTVETQRRKSRYQGELYCALLKG